MIGFRCDTCSSDFAQPPVMWRCGCGGPLSVTGRGRLDPARLSSRPPTMWRYREAIGLDAGAAPVTLGEGMTPLVRRTVGGLPVRLKLEVLNPTGSFKDRGASVVASEMAARGVTEAVEDSSGNAGAALAAYGSRAGLTMHIVAPEGAPAAKLAAIRGAGGRLSLVAGGRDAAGREARRRAEAGVSFASHVWNPFFLEGTRTLAFEIWEQMGGRLPDRIFLPVGNGSLLIGAATGFEDLVRQGLAPAAPRLMAVQALACAPLVSGAPPPDPARPSVADGIRIASPPRGPRMKAVVSASGGRFLAVSEEEILEARRTLGRSGLDVEPTAAAAFAGCLAWSAREPAGGDEPPVVVLTGSGLKVPAAPSRGPEVTGP